MKFTKYVRLPNYRRFSYHPQFFNPEEEAIKARQESVRLDIQETNKPQASFTGAFQRDRSADTQRRFIRLVILLVLTGISFGYIAMGSRIFTVAFCGTLPIYVLYRWKIVKKKK